MKKEQIAEKMIEEIMEDFDFGKVHRVMVQTKHKWADMEGTEKVPSIYRIMKHAEELLRTCASHYGDMDDFSISSGGFMARLDAGMLYLHYVLEEKTSYDLDYKGSF